VHVQEQAGQRRVAARSEVAGLDAGLLPARGPVHEKLVPKLMRFPPTLLDRLTALSKAYGLDQTSTIRLALTEMYERAIKAGTIEAV